jgi:hypothetical protein
MTSDRLMRTAEEEFYARHIAPDASDEEIADKVADYLVTMFPRSKTYHLSVSHDVRPDAVRQLERMRKRYPTYQHDGHIGPCPLHYDWAVRNIVGITTRDQTEARQWAIEAMLAGYAVFRRPTRAGAGYGRGSIANLRKSWRTELARTPR